MKKNRWFVLSVILFAALAATAATAQDDAAKLTREIETLHAAQEKASLAGNYDALLSHFAEDVIICADTRAPIKGRAAMRAAYRENEKEGVKLHAISSIIDTLWTCGDRIYLRGSFGQSASSRKSPNPVAIHGSYLEIYKRRPDGRHLVEYLIWNLGFNPFEGGK